MRWKNASSFVVNGIFALAIVGRSLMAHWIEPLAQRCCCDLNALISGGICEGQVTFGR